MIVWLLRDKWLFLKKRSLYSLQVRHKNVILQVVQVIPGLQKDLCNSNNDHKLINEQYSLGWDIIFTWSLNDIK